MDQLLERFAQLERMLDAIEQREHRDIARLRDALDDLRIDIQCIKNNSHPATELRRNPTVEVERPKVRRYYAQ